MLKAEVLRQKLVIGEGYAGNWEDYRHRVGVIKGLEQALELCEQANKKFTER